MILKKIHSEKPLERDWVRDLAFVFTTSICHCAYDRRHFSTKFDVRKFPNKDEPSPSCIVSVTTKDSGMTKIKLLCNNETVCRSLQCNEITIDIVEDLMRKMIALIPG